MPSTFRSSRLILTTGLLLLSLGAASAQVPAPPSEPYRVGGEVTRPEKIAGLPPVYTELARKARVQGVVIVEVVVDEKGNVADPRILKGLPMGLDRASLEAVATWKFKPATLNGTPVKVYYTLTVNFQLDADISFGPAFGAFRSVHPHFAERMGSRRFDSALELLDGLAADWRRPGRRRSPTTGRTRTSSITSSESTPRTARTASRTRRGARIWLRLRSAPKTGHWR